MGSLERAWKGNTRVDPWASLQQVVGKIAEGWCEEGRTSGGGAHLRLI